MPEDIYSSNLKIASEDIDASAASTFAVDVAGFYQSEEIAYSDFNGRWRAGFNMQNLGPKISYDNDDLSSNFLPANLRLGGGFDFILDDYNKVALSVEFTKLLVPTPPGPGTPVDAKRRWRLYMIREKFLKNKQTLQTTKTTMI